MRPQLSLSAQVLILVTLPLIIQLGSFILLGYLQHQAEQELKSSTKARRIAGTINLLQNAAVAAIARYGKESDFEYPTLDPIGALETKFQDYYKTLLSLTADDPELHALELHLEAATQADIALVIKDTDIVFEGDEEKLQRVLSNLISNAIKFSPPKGTITVKAQSGSRDLRIIVEDNGPGIPTDQLQSVFERFYQVETQKKTGGSGLGLAICKAITNLHAGNIWVESEEGKGSKFIVSLPAMMATNLNPKSSSDSDLLTETS